MALNQLIKSSYGDFVLSDESQKQSQFTPSTPVARTGLGAKMVRDWLYRLLFIVVLLYLHFKYEDNVNCKIFMWRLRLLRFARNDIDTCLLSLRGAKRRSNLYFGNKSL
jgi:hypothetical protein